MRSSIMWRSQFKASPAVQKPCGRLGCRKDSRWGRTRKRIAGNIRATSWWNSCNRRTHSLKLNPWKEGMSWDSKLCTPRVCPHIWNKIPKYSIQQTFFVICELWMWSYCDWDSNDKLTLIAWGEILIRWIILQVDRANTQFVHYSLPERKYDKSKCPQRENMI